jgi:endonuclease YncB( thermonuclease family)
MANTTKTNPEKILTEAQYSNLLKELKDLIETGIDEPSKDGINQLTTTYWKIGQRINKASLSTKSGYHNSILKDLSSQLELERTTLSRCLTFFKNYPTPPNNQNLSWSHYRELLTIKDDKLRTALEKKAQTENWSRSRLVEAIRQSQTFPNKKDIKIQRPTEATYIYKSKIIEVIDGDTIILNIDLGFQVWKEQRVRLAQINTPELPTPKGKAAHNFLRSKLAKLDSIIIQTKKIDIYGRYIAHIFYNPSPEQKRMTSDEIFKKGIYLNEEIVRAGFAEVV